MLRNTKMKIREDHPWRGGIVGWHQFDTGNGSYVLTTTPKYEEDPFVCYFVAKITDLNLVE